MHNTLDHTLLHLSLIPGIGPATIERFTQNLTLEQLSHIYTFTKADCLNSIKLPDNTAEKIVAGLAQKQLLEKELELIAKHDISWATILAENYPAMLKSIHLAPTILYWQGELEPRKEKTIACVGSRKSNFYGNDVVNYILPELLEDAWTLVSGGALGIDTLVHKKALQHKGITYAVLGSGLLKPYPGSNSFLFKEIAASGGAVISSFPLQQEPLAGNFPSRNRIIAGLSKACLVIQAAEKSGALITARFALEQGREVCAIPGSILDPLSKGCNRLIEQGATPILESGDILKALGYGQTKIRYQQKTIISEATFSQKIITLCEKAKSFDELLVLLACTEQELHDELFSLQLMHTIEQNFMGLWQSL